VNVTAPDGASPPEIDAVIAEGAIGLPAVAVGGALTASDGFTGAALTSSPCLWPELSL
jgi:hypothetical protein